SPRRATHLQLRIRGRGGRGGVREAQRTAARREDAAPGAREATMSEQPTADALRAVPLLSGLTEAERAEVAGLAEVKSLEAQLPLCGGGGGGEALTSVRWGSAGVVRRAPSGKHGVLGVVSAPAIGGERAVRGGGGRRGAWATGGAPFPFPIVRGPPLRQRLA